MLHPPLTVGLPIYNAQHFLEDCLANLLAEDLDFRVFISDNASTDQTQDIVQDFADRDQRIAYIRQPSNIGARENFRFLLDHAESEFFAWRACDDLSSPGYFQRLTAVLQESPDRSLAVGGLKFVDSDGNPPADREVPAALPADRQARRAVLFRCAAPAWVYGVFRREPLARWRDQARSGFSYTWGFDTLSILPFLLDASIVTVPDVYFVEYLTGASAERYRPQGVIKPARMVASYWRVGFQFADQLSRSLPERVSMYRDVVRYANGSAEKYKRIVKRAAFWPYYRATGRL